MRVKEKCHPFYDQVVFLLTQFCRKVPAEVDANTVHIYVGHVLIYLSILIGFSIRRKWLKLHEITIQANVIWQWEWNFNYI